ncbi:YbhB/YbcL family Raf kinase inhibitor-like protein [Mycobacterium yunnanensis]|uniref:YbhB/YbcL family Raf kinase inhibitor-like protein n=1 Tax=Mycobacterium yunnanensis TaxID=368477 RepID=A0A9X2YIN8_9MYCO|nr:YbhB/YbcL family Raf kinase inhibitor-like protein [Mycobacterium yunnanensis]
MRPVRSSAQRSRLAQIETPLGLVVTSPSFADGAPIPRRHAGRGVGDDVSPALAWTGLPDATSTVVLIIEDDDVPLPRPLWHTVAVLGGSVVHLDEGALGPDASDVVFLKTPLGRRYSGPRPIPGHGVHHYRFHVFGLSTPLRPDTTGRTELLRDLRATATACGTLTGTYRRP